jgi:hypothetical protein
MKIKMKMIRNKRGGDKVISGVYGFAIFFIVAAAIIYMTASFYGKPYDVRLLEENALANRIVDCVSVEGYIKEEALTPDFSNDFLIKCNLNFEVEDVYDWKSQGQFYAEMEIFDFNSKDKISGTSAGNINLKDFCEMKGKYLPTCLKRSFYSIDKSNKQYQINILSIVNKINKNA